MRSSISRRHNWRWRWIKLFEVTLVVLEVVVVLYW